MKKIYSLVLLFLLVFSISACSTVKDSTEKDLNDSGINDTLNDDMDNKTPGEVVDDTIEKITPTGSLSEDVFTVEDNMPQVSKYSQYSEKICGFGFKKESKGIVPSIGIYQKYFEGNKALYIGDTNLKTIYLTFDEGYENGYTGKILDTLKEKNVPAAFFCTGDYVKKNDALIKRMLEEGHIVGNHSWNHKTMPGIKSDEEFKDELIKFDNYMEENYNSKVKYFRYPNGEFSEKSLKMVDDMGYNTVFWSLAYKDWEADVIRGAEYAVSEVTNYIHNGAIILLHAVSKDNTDALAEIIDCLREEGYVFSSLDNLKFD